MWSMAEQPPLHCQAKKVARKKKAKPDLRQERGG
jgi:hypothetical protein